MRTSGSVPGPSTASCMVSAHNGTKIILFGGQRGKILLGDLHVLDVRTLVWTKEHAVDPTENRSHMACAVGGDSFIVWGVRLSKTTVQAGMNSGTPLVYNLRSKR
ncbi:hypothetical protein BGX33_001797 [Mortierella sp. NVP41]|nr:hypothetical protein BGX33_001797 [Mortierella sp. NVP41]